MSKMQIGYDGGKLGKDDIADLRDRIFEAAQTLRKQPNKDRRGSSNSWPTIILTYWEAYGQQAVRLRLSPPTAKEIDRCDEVMGWLTWLGGKDRITMKCVWLCCGENYAPSQVVGIMGLHRNTVRLRRDGGLQLIGAKFYLRAAA